MTQGFDCGDKAALIGFLYDDCEPGEREQIAAHLAQCAECTTELTSLGATRRELAAWMPPPAALGFQVDPAQVAAPVTTPLRAIDGGLGEGPRRPGAAGPMDVRGWWRRPLPAWAQAAAALLIFSSGLALGASRTLGGQETNIAERGSNTARSVPAATSVTPVAVASPEQLASLEQQLRQVQSQVAQLKSASPAPQATAGVATLTEVHTIVENAKLEVLDKLLPRNSELLNAWVNTQADQQRMGRAIEEVRRVQPSYPLGSPAVYGLTPTTVSFKPRP